MAIIKTYPLKSNYYGLDRLLLSDMQPDAQGVVHGETKSLTLASLKSFIGSGSDAFTLVVDRTSGASTFDTNTKILNIPDYSVGNVDGSGTAGRIPKWQDSNTLDDSEIFQSGTNIGIGTTNPNDGDLTIGTPKLHVAAAGTSGTFNLAARFQSTTTDADNTGTSILINSFNDRGLLIRAGRKDSDRAVAYFDLVDSVGNLTNMLTMGKFGSSFYTGIGTLTPTEKLEVAGKIKATGTADVLQLYRDSSSQANYIKFYDNATSSPEFYLGFTSNNRDFQISNLASSGTIALRSGGGSTMMLDSDQKVGIGTTAPAYKLDVSGDLRAKGITSSTTHTVTIEATAGWYRIMQWGGSSRGGAILKLSTTGGNVAPTTYVINAYKTYGDPASSNTLKLEQYGNGGYITNARIATDSVTSVTYVEIYNAYTTANYTMEVYHDSLLGLDSLTSVLTGTLETGPNSVSQDFLPFVYEGTTTEKSSSELVTLIGDGANDGKLRFNCSANSHYVEVVGPTHSGGSSYSLKLPNSLPSVSNQILEANALGVLSWIPTPSGGGSGGGTLNTVGLTMPSAFSVGNSPLTGTGGTISVTTTGGSAGQYLDYQGNWSTPAGTTPPVDSVSDGTSGASSGSALTVSPTTGAVKVTSNSFAGAANVGHVPSSAAASQTSTFLRADGTWVTPTNTTYSTMTTSTLGLGKLRYANNSTPAAQSQTTTAGRTYGITENGSGQLVVNVPWSGGSGGGISFSGTTAGGLATYTNSSTAGVSSKVTLNASGLMAFDAPDTTSAGSIDFEPTGKILKIGDLSSGNSGIVEIFTNGNRQFQIGINGEIGVGQGASQGTSGQFLQSQGNGSPAIWTSSGAGGGSSGTSGMVQLADGSSGFTNSASLFWDIISGLKGKLVIGKNTSGTYDREGILKLVGGPNSAGTSGVGGTIELEAAVGKSSNPPALTKIKAPVSNSTAQSITLPSSLPTATSQVLGVTSITGSEVVTAWTNASGSGITQTIMPWNATLARADGTSWTEINAAGQVRSDTMVIQSNECFATIQGNVVNYQFYIQGYFKGFYEASGQYAAITGPLFLARCQNADGSGTISGIPIEASQSTTVIDNRKANGSLVVTEDPFATKQSSSIPAVVGNMGTYWKLPIRGGKVGRAYSGTNTRPGFVQLFTSNAAESTNPGKDHSTCVYPNAVGDVWYNNNYEYMPENKGYDFVFAGTITAFVLQSS